MHTNFPRLRHFAFSIVTSFLFTAQSGFCAEVPEHAKTLLVKAKSEVEACEFEGAIEDCGEAIKQGLHSSDVYIWRGCAYMHIGDFKHAEEDFQKA
jgi:Tfp pilus assembly protein PilF